MPVFEGRLQEFIDNHANSYDLYNDDYIVLNDSIVDKLFDEKYGLVKYHNFIIEDSQQKLFDDEELMRKLIDEDGYIFKFASERLKDNREFVKYAVSSVGMLLSGISDVKSASPLEYVHERFRDDKEIVLVAAEEDSDALRYASSRLKNDRDFVIKMIKLNPISLKYADPKFYNDKEVVKLASISTGWENYEFYHAEIDHYLLENPNKQASDFFFADRKYMPNMFQYASDELKADREFVFDLVKNSANAGSIYKYISEELKNDKEIALACCK